MEPHGFALRIHVLQQTGPKDMWGRAKTAEMLNQITGGWVYMWADDAMPEKPLFRRLWETVQSSPNAGAVVFSERVGRFSDTTVAATPQNMQANRVEGHQVCWKRDFLGNHRYNGAHGRGADWHLITDLYRQFPNRFVFVNEPLINFNHFCTLQDN